MLPGSASWASRDRASSGLCRPHSGHTFSDLSHRLPYTIVWQVLHKTHWRVSTDAVFVSDMRSIPFWLHKEAAAQLVLDGGQVT
jgi:hypothetical protein